MHDWDIRDSLARENDEYRFLLAQHQDFESRLSELQRRPYLTVQDEVERTNIKKHKLRLKDRMEWIARTRKGC